MPQGKEVHYLPSDISEERNQQAKFSNDSKLVLIESMGTILHGNTYLSVGLWDARSGKQINTFPADHGVISTDGTYVTTVSERFTRWTIKTGEPVQKFAPEMLAFEGFSPDGIYALVQNPHGTLTLVNVQNSSRLYVFGPNIQIATFFPDSTKLLLEDKSVPEQPKFIVWDIASSKELVTISPEMPADLYRISSDGKNMAILLSDMTINFWNLNTGEKVYDFCG